MIYAFVFLSGAAALVYEVVWARQLTTFLGITTYAHTIVLASFMAGLALGGWWLGRRADRVGDPLLLFARLEAGIALFGVLTVVLVPLLQKLYIAIAPDAATGWTAHGARLLMAGAAVLPPTIMMGGTLPALVRGLRLDSDPLARTMAAVYAANTLGAAGGALATGYGLLPALGARGSLLVAVGLNLCVSAAVVLWRGRLSRARGSEVGPSQPSRLVESPLSREQRRIVLLAFGLSGAAALALQIAWIRALTQIIGSSVYAFGLTTASYLAGLAGGSALAAAASRPLARHGWTMRAAAAIELGVGLTVLAGVPVLERLPELFLLGYRIGVHESFVQLQLFGFVMASAVMVVPTLLIGALYPLLAARSTRRAEETGRGIGAAMAINASGTVGGALLAGLVLLPPLGADGLLVAAAILSAVVAALLIGADHASPGRTRLLTLGSGLVVFLLLAMAIPAWDPVIMTSGPFINAARFVDVQPGETLREWIRGRSRILYYEEGIEGTVSVRDVGHERLLVINGKTDGSRFGDRRTQLMLAHLPLLSHPSPRRVLLIGLGTGMSAAAAAAHGNVEELTVVEISREVIEASQFFVDENQSVLTDPRVSLVRADARNFLLTSGDRFDVVLSEPSNPWITGVANLFTREFFGQARARLAPGGVMAQWFQTYGMSPQDLQSVLRSFADVFPQVTVWSPQLGDLLLLGSVSETSLSVDRLRLLATTWSSHSQLKSMNVLEAEDAARLFLLDDLGVRSLVAGAEVNTDDRPRVEFSAPRNLYAETTLANVVGIIEHLDGRTLTAPIDDTGTVYQRDSRATDMSALGLTIELDGIAPGRVEWRVAWTALRHQDGSERSPAVAARPVLVLAVGSARIEIERSGEPSPATDSELVAWVRHRYPGARSPVPVTLASGEDAVLMTLEHGSVTRSLLGWSCRGRPGREEEGIYVALPRSQTDERVSPLDRLADRLHCGSRPDLRTHRPPGMPR